MIEIPDDIAQSLVEGANVAQAHEDEERARLIEMSPELEAAADAARAENDARVAEQQATFAKAAENARNLIKEHAEAAGIEYIAPDPNVELKETVVGPWNANSSIVRIGGPEQS